MGKLYKAGADSYTEKNIDPLKAVGIWHHRYLAKEGLRTHNPDHLQAFFYYSQLARQAEYDYVVLSDKRTNSGREEAVKITSRIANKGKMLIDAGYAPSPRKAYDHTAKICKGDMRIPAETEPRHIDDLPDVPTAKNISSPACLNAHEDELLALIDCLTGEGDKAKAFRAIARYLIKEAITMEQEEGDKA